MRKIYLTGWMALLLTGCQLETPFEEPGKETRTHSVIVTVQKDPASRTAIQEDGTVASYVWTAGDEDRFHIFENGVEATSVTMSLNPENTIATLTATFPDRTAENYSYSAIYAGTLQDGAAIIPAKQRPEVASFDPSADILVSAKDIVSEGAPAASLQFSLIREVSVNKMTLKGLAEGEVLQSVVLSSSDKEFIPGSRSLVFDFSGKDIQTGTDIPVYFISDAVENASFQIEVMTDKAIYLRDNFSSKLTFEKGTVHRFGLLLGSYRHDGGTAEYPWVIASRADMEAVPDRMIPETKVYFKVVADIDMTGCEWIPLNNASPYNKYIDFDGGGHTISNLTPKDGEAYPSLFGVMYGSVRDLTIDHATITPGESIKGGVFAGYIGTSSRLEACTVDNITISNSSVGTNTNKATDFCGALAAQVAAEATISNIHISDCEVAGTNYAGGMVAQIDAETTISGTNTVTRTDVYGKLAGGVVGFSNAKVTMSGCSYSHGSVTSSERYCGGMLGSVASYASVISDCHVTGATISGGTDRTGGFAGQEQKAAFIKNCSVTNSSVTTATVNVGGFVGVHYGTIEHSYVDHVSVSSGNTANETKVSAGGFSGYFEEGNLTNCYAADVTVDVTGDYVSGLVGMMRAKTTSASIRNCYSSGIVKGSYRHVAGIAGGLTTGGTYSIEDCYSVCTLTANSYIGGLVGEVLSDITTVAIKNCYACGDVTSTSFAAGGLVGIISAQGTTMSGCAAWNDKVYAKSIGSSNWSSGAVAGVAFPTCSLSGNYRNPSMNLTAWWVPDAGFQHPDVSASAPLIVKDISTGSLRATTASSIASGQDNRPQYAYHGKVESGKTLSELASTTLGWSSDTWDFSGDLPTLIGCGPSGGSGSSPSVNPWDENRGKIVRPVAGNGWTVSQVADGVTYYAYSGTDAISGTRQDVYVTDLDLSNTGYAVRFSFTDGGATTASVHADHNAVATINATFELGSVFTRIDGYNWSVLRNDFIKDTEVPNWKSEAALYVNSIGRGVRIGFDGKGRSLDQLRSFYRANTWPNLFSSAPMLVDDYEPVGESFVDATLTQEQLAALDYEDPNRHQGVRHPRTAVALTENNHFLMIVVDGRYRSSVGGVGMTAKELTQFLVTHFNPQYALNMDGGGSSTMCVEGLGDSSTHEVNYPCEGLGSGNISTHQHGHERTVSTHILIVRHSD